MRLEGFGIRLVTLTAATAEVVRQWRNQQEILSQMEYQQIISEKEQQVWFEAIRDDTCRYFMILFGHQPVGMIHLAQIDRESRTAEAGLFIGEPSFSGTGIALGASLLLLDHAFDDLKLENIKAKVRNTNTTAIQYNQLLGFKIERQLGENFSQFELTKDVYRTKRSKLTQLMARI